MDGASRLLAHEGPLVIVADDRIEQDDAFEPFECVRQDLDVLRTRQEADDERCRALGNQKRNVAAKLRSRPTISLERPENPP